MLLLFTWAWGSFLFGVAVGIIAVILYLMFGVKWVEGIVDAIFDKLSG